MSLWTANGARASAAAVPTVLTPAAGYIVSGSSRAVLLTATLILSPCGSDSKSNLPLFAECSVVEVTQNLRFHVPPTNLVIAFLDPI